MKNQPRFMSDAFAKHIDEVEELTTTDFHQFVVVKNAFVLKNGEGKMGYYCLRVYMKDEEIEKETPFFVIDDVENNNYQIFL